MGLRGYVLDTKCGLRFDVQQFCVLTRIRQDVSARKCRVDVLSFLLRI